jgi:hypothetical protein
MMEAHIRGILAGDSSRQPDEVVLLVKVVYRFSREAVALGVAARP